MLVIITYYIYNNNYNINEYKAKLDKFKINTIYFDEYQDVVRKYNKINMKIIVNYLNNNIKSKKIITFNDKKSKNYITYYYTLYTKNYNSKNNENTIYLDGKYFFDETIKENIINNNLINIWYLSATYDIIQENFLLNIMSICKYINLDLYLDNLILSNIFFRRLYPIFFNYVLYCSTSDVYCLYYRYANYDNILDMEIINNVIKIDKTINSIITQFSLDISYLEEVKKNIDVILYNYDQFTIDIKLKNSYNQISKYDNKMRNINDDYFALKKYVDKNHCIYMDTIYYKTEISKININDVKYKELKKYLLEYLDIYINKLTLMKDLYINIFNKTYGTNVIKTSQ